MCDPSRSEKVHEIVATEELVHGRSFFSHKGDIWMFSSEPMYS